MVIAVVLAYDSAPRFGGHQRGTGRQAVLGAVRRRPYGVAAGGAR
jgi:hypothetical protein